jgi:hypothetical protein
MLNRTKLLAGVALCVATTTLVAAAAQQRKQPYQTISERNVFGLRPALPDIPPPPLPVRSPPLPIVRLTGLTDLTGEKVALLEISYPGGPVKKPIMSEGEKADDVEVLEIDLDSSQVRMQIAGVQTNLTFAPPRASAPPSPPGLAASRSTGRVTTFGRR